MAFEQLKRDLREQFWIRLHMALILLVCVLVGFIANRALHGLGVHSMPWRYGGATLVGYGVFFGGVRLWLWYVGVLVDNDTARERRRELAENPSEVADIGLDVAGTADDAASGLSDLGQVVSGAADGEGCLLLLLGAVLLVVALGLSGGALWMLYEAPLLLGEVAVQAMLAAGLLRASRRMDVAGWAGSVWQQTRWAFAACLLAAVIMGVGLQQAYPDATTLGEVLAQRSAAKAR